MKLDPDIDEMTPQQLAPQRSDRRIFLRHQWPAGYRMLKDAGMLEEDLTLAAKMTRQAARNHEKRGMDTLMAEEFARDGYLFQPTTWVKLPEDEDG